MNEARPSEPRRARDVARFDLEADVLVLERAGAGGGTSANSGGLIDLGGGTPVQKACGFDDTPEEMYAFLHAASQPGACEEKVRLFCEGSVELFHWLEGKGCPSSPASIPSPAWNPVVDRVEGDFPRSGNREIVARGSGELLARAGTDTETEGLRFRVPCRCEGLGGPLVDQDEAGSVPVHVFANTASRASAALGRICRKRR